MLIYQGTAITIYYDENKCGINNLLWLIKYARMLTDYLYVKLQAKLYSNKKIYIIVV